MDPTRAAIVPTHRRDVQALRGLAVLSVVLFHANPRYFPAGYLGVDTFFVISGFVVSPLLVRIIDAPAGRERLARLGSFYARRVRRLLPALGVMLVVTAVLSLLLAPVGASQVETAKLGLLALVLAANIGAAIILGDYFHHAPNPLIHAWSLSVEEQFYLVLPALLVAVAIVARARPRRLAAGLLLVITAISITMTLAAVFAGPFQFYSATSRAWEFGLGGLVILFRQTRTAKPNAWFYSVSAAALAMVLLSPWLLPARFPAAEALAAAITAVVLLTAPTTERQHRWLTSIEWCGDRSYAIYLWHMPLMVILRDSPVVSLTRSNAGIAAGLIGAFVLGDLSYRLIEQRFRERGSREASSMPLWRLAVVFIGLPAVALGLLGLGARSRFGQAEALALVEVPAWQADPACDRLNTPRPCHYGIAGATATALLSGDSHAGALSQAFVDAALRQRLSADVWALAFCPLWDLRLMADAQRATIQRTLGRACLDRSVAVLDHIRRTKPAFVVVTARSSADYGDYLGAGGSALYLSATESTLASLAGFGGRLIIVGPVPEFPRVNFGFAIFQRPHFRPIDRTQLPSEPFHEDRALATIAGRIGATFISGVAPFCNATDCSYQWFLDHHHLSPSGAERLRPALERAFQP